MYGDEGDGRLWERLRGARGLARLAILLTWRASPRLVLAIMLLVLLQALLPVAELAVSKRVIDRVAIDLGLAGAPEAMAEGPPLAVWIALAAAIIAAGQLIQPFATTFHSLAGDRLTGYITGELIGAANRWRGLARFEDPAFADDLERSRRNAAHGGLNIMREGTYAATALATAVGLALALAGLHPLAPLSIVLATVPMMLGQREYAQRTRNHIYMQTPESRRLAYWREAVLTPEPAKDVRLYGLPPYFLRRYEEGFERTTGELDRLRRGLSLRVAASSALSALAVGAVYAFAAWRVSRGDLPLGGFVLYGGAATLLQARLLDLGLFAGSFPMEMGFLPSLFRVLDAPPDLPVPASPLRAPRPIREGISFEDVHFAYPRVDATVLRGVSFRIRPGESLALVGRNGAGKTTIVKLLLRMYDPTGGRITLDGVDLREYDPEDLRLQAGVVFQEFGRYELTAGENIGLGRVDRLADRALLIEAARKGGAAELITELPRGLDTPLGREFGGRELSGGEWQKLALARAFARDAQVLVLDEPTASLDMRAEYEVYERFSELTRGRATLLISHRFSTVRMAERILYLDDGRVLEDGSHQELIARGGEYARMYALQAARYVVREAREVDA